ncbi:MAG: UDP-N-acetylmuramate dehydrogenase [Desulfobulbus sp.]|nr:UDP-N-acetylmuramate dehydrogenase [Desulfobulbus sp.]
MNEQQRQQLHTLCSKVTWEANMAAYSTFRAGGVVEAFAEVCSEDELIALLPWLNQEQIPWQVIGGGSNILVATRRNPGVFIRLRGSVRESFVVDQAKKGKGPVLVRVAAGCSLPAFVGWCSKNSLDGLTFMAGIPGSVGGAVRMNAGAFGHSIGERVQLVRCVGASGKICEIPREKMCFSYRSTRLPREKEAAMFITGVLLNLQHGDQAQISHKCRDIISQRKQKQPQGVASAGSFFKNPAGDFAGRLIESAGLKGLAQGKAMVSPRHANFIVNTGGALPEDIVALMEKVRQTVLQQSGVLLEPEVRIF